MVAPISRNQGFMGVCGNKGLPQKMEKIKLNEKLHLGRAIKSTKTIMTYYSSKISLYISLEISST